MLAHLSLPAPPSVWIRRLAESSWTWGEWKRGQKQRLGALGCRVAQRAALPHSPPPSLTGSPYAEHPLARAGRTRAATVCPWAAGKLPLIVPEGGGTHPTVPTPMLGALSTGNQWRGPAGQGAPRSCPFPGSQTAARARHPLAAPPHPPAPLNMRASALRSQLLR